ncbi:fumarylacetoacetate hydrolase family protein [Pontibacillus marinus]|uniref:fumarylacetoacetate hydrolase family protein n=1 Tax=Pontibacillus marinus TaxID=273164 RepID=UPI000427A4C2|nr:fumarylacetoacetate hydrolase family protein [Pontibacillus marinus]
MRANDKSIRNIYCIGRNYAQHAQEMGSDLPTKPMIFSKPTHALHPAEGDLELPSEIGQIHYEVELVVKMAEAYDPEKPLEQMIDGVALGIDLTARDVQTQLKEKGHPWLVSKGFKGSAVLTEFIPFESLESFEKIEFSLEKNKEVVQKGTPTQMIFSLKELFSYIASNLGLGKGDVVYTGTPEGVGPLQDGDVLEMKAEFSGSEKNYGPLKVIFK